MPLAAPVLDHEQIDKRNYSERSEQHGRHDVPGHRGPHRESAA
jgi:hypothetical protein